MQTIIKMKQNKNIKPEQALSLIPKLRFPEFEGEWEEKLLGKVVDYENGKAHEQEIDEEGKFIVVNSKFISTDGGVKKFSNSANLLAQKNDILMVLSDVPNGKAIAKCFIVDKDDTYTVNQRICKLTPKENISIVLYYLINRNPYFLSFDDGVKQTNLRKDDVLNCPLIIPNEKSEQQKIASFLSSLDERIAAETQKLEALNRHKKGLMQNLFPATGETTPKLRFKGFEGEWKEVKLRDVSAYFNGGSFENDVQEEEKYELVTLKSIDTSGNLVHSKRFIDIEVPTLSKDTLVMILSEQAPGLLGMTALIPIDNKYVLNQRVAEIRPNNNVESYFLSMAINRNQRYFSKLGAGTKVQNITKPNVENYEFLLPALPEQQKIAACLSSLDEIITAQGEKIEKLKQHKKGLMQQMFPNPAS
jgi:type I restriction enzyme S subunit